MWKKIILASVFPFTLIASATPSNSQHVKHLESLKSKHPFGLIGDDFGLLVEQDLAINECDVYPEPFPPKAGSFPYWQCFETKEVTVICDHGGIQDPKEGIEAFIVLTVSRKQGGHEYIARRPMNLKSCHHFKKNFERLRENTKNTCISGSFIEEKTDKKGNKLAYWVFDKYKTKKGCDSYFEGACSFKYQLKHGCILSSTKKVSR